ncbi:MAG: TrmJ/YjtD family RNA methyltransferase [Hyphomicrobiaceae bacterium]|nr:TrmJ/YjtD family RNA methyltransferase [Hyphomicrobiaceae bacterium]
MRAVDPNHPEKHAPAIATTRLTVADVVATAYRETVEAAGRLAEPPLTREEVRAAIDFCADEACAAAGVFCPGCRKWTEREGLATLDQLCARYQSITFADTGLVLSPGGPLPPATFPSLDELARSWAGEEVWYLARRVIRRLKKLDDPRPKRLTGIAGEDFQASPTFVLVRPQLADNIGMVARAMANFGLDELRLVAPRDGWPNEKARAAASGANYIIDAAAASGTLAEAIGDLNFVCATTARQRDLAKPVLTPEQAAQEMRRRIEAGERCGIVFGPERAGLETDEVALADAVVMAPVNPRFASLNLAQAVLLVGYEWLKETKRGTLGRVTAYEEALAPGLNTRGSPPASKEELLGFFDHLESELARLGFFNPPHKRQTVMRNVRTMFARMGASEQEVRTLRGIVATLSRGKGTGRKPPT